MSKLRQSVLVFIRTMGNHSGCHQLPERSFFYKGKQFPVCARCTGVFIGHILAIIINSRRNIKTSACLPGLAVMGIDWGIQEAGIMESSNPRRLLTGIIGGFALYSLYANIIKWICRK